MNDTACDNVIMDDAVFHEMFINTTLKGCFVKKKIGPHCVVGVLSITLIT